MDEAELDLLGQVVRSNSDVDLPTDRRELALLATFLERNPGFDADDPTANHEAFGAARDDLPDGWLPEAEADRDRLEALLERHDDLELLSTLVAADDTRTLLEGLGLPDGQGRGVGTPEHDRQSSAGVEAGDSDGAVSADELDEDDLDSTGELLARTGGGVVCLSALVTMVLTGFTVYKSVDGWFLSVEFHDVGAIIGASSVVALLAGLGVGLGYRTLTTDIHDNYRKELAWSTAEVPFVGFVVAVLVYFLLPVVLNAIALRLADAFLYLVGLVIVLVIFGVPVLMGLAVAIGLVVGVPAYAGIFGGSLLGTSVSKATGDG